MPEPSEHKESDSILPASVTEEDRQYVDRYTIKKRKIRDRVANDIPLGARIRRTIEGANRRLWYKVFALIFDNPPLKKKIPIAELRSIFILPIGDAVGDMVITLPLFHAIKRRNPDCKIGTMVSSRNKTLVRYEDTVDHRYMFRDKNDFRHYPELFRARKDGYDLVISMRMNHMTEFGIICNVIGPHAYKICATHARKNQYKILFNELLPLDRYKMHLSQLGLAMLESVIGFDDSFEQWESRPTFMIPQEIRTTVGEQINSELRRIGAEWYIHFNPQARNPSREWGLDNAFEFAHKFVEHYPKGAIFFSASPVQREAIEDKIFSLKLDRVIYFPTSYDLLELAVLSEQSELIVTPDTSAIHFGTASGKPTLTLWPDPNDLPLAWIPLQVPSINLAPEKTGMPVPSIPVDTVWKAACMLLDKKWTATSTSIGLNPECAPLYQASTNSVPIGQLLKSHSVSS